MVIPKYNWGSCKFIKLLKYAHFNVANRKNNSMTYIYTHYRKIISDLQI